MKIGIPNTGYSSAKGWKTFFRSMYDNVELVDIKVRKNMPEDIDLVFFDGGSDINPALYGEKKHKTTHVNISRDWQEVIIYEFYAKLHTLFAGVCRGSQFLNVMKGGTLYQDLPSINKAHSNIHLAHIIDPIFAHDMGLNGNKYLVVNSTHHQAVKDMGKGLIPILREPRSGIIEGFRSIDDTIRAVQSHPEYGESKYTSRIRILNWLFRQNEYKYSRERKIMEYFNTQKEV